MSKLDQIQRIKKIFSEGGNLIEFLREKDVNDTESIMISYDFQAGSYIEGAKKNSEYLDKYSDALSEVIRVLGDIESIMEVGVGEATLMTPLMLKVDKNNKITKWGFDISWSRIKYAREYSKSFGIDINLFTADLFNIPLPDNSIDIVYTSHSLEPNGQREREALIELCRVTAKYLVLLEPGYDFADDDGKARMNKHGYIKHIEKHASELGYKVIEHRKFDHSINPQNPTALTIISKEPAIKQNPQLLCPLTKTKLEEIKGSLFSKNSLLVYPIIDGIPCLLSDNAILAAHFNS